MPDAQPAAAVDQPVRQTPAFKHAKQLFLTFLAPHAQRLGIISAGGRPIGGLWVLEVRALDPRRLAKLPRQYRGFPVTVVTGRLAVEHTT